MPDVLRFLVRSRAGSTCEYCLSQEKYSPDPFCSDHIIPRSKGGPGTSENLAWSCQGCNSRKYIHDFGIDPVTGRDAPLYNPRRHRWPEHFMWNEDFSLLIGKSHIGRATIARLDLNRPGVVNLRLILVKMGEHPPG